MEPITLVVGGIALYKFLSGRPSAPSTAPLAIVAGTGATAPMATATSVVNGVSIAQAADLVRTGQDVPYTPSVPSDLALALDNDTAMAMREYARLDPSGLQAFLDRYTDRVVLRDDLMWHRLTDPRGAPPIEATPQMITSMGMAAYKVAQALNGVAAGRSVDVFGVAATAAGQLPGINPDLISGLQAAALSYRAISTFTDIVTMATANGVEVLNMTSMVAAGAYPGLGALPLAGTLMAIGLVVDIGFTIIGDRPDMQKAIDVALDAVSIGVLFIPVIGVVVAIIIQLVKFIIDLFGDALFGGGGLTHEQREALEAARYGEHLNPMFGELSHALTPRELFAVILRWGSGYCGGTHDVAMGVNLILRAGNTVMVGGRPYTVPSDMLLPFGQQGCYWLQPTPFAAMSNDEQAWALGAYASINGVQAGAQVGVADWRKDAYETPTEATIKARTAPMRTFLVTHKLSLDQIDTVTAEYRAQPHLAALATAFGFVSWQELFAWVVADEWHAFQAAVSHGSLADFARTNGYPTMYAFRAAALARYEALYAEASGLAGELAARLAQWQADYLARLG